MVDPIFPGLLGTGRGEGQGRRGAAGLPGPPIPVAGSALGGPGPLTVTSFLPPPHPPLTGVKTLLIHITDSLRCLLCARPLSPQAGGEGGKVL